MINKLLVWVFQHFVALYVREISLEFSLRLGWFPDHWQENLPIKNKRNPKRVSSSFQISFNTLENLDCYNIDLQVSFDSPANTFDLVLNKPLDEIFVLYYFWKHAHARRKRILEKKTKKKKKRCWAKFFVWIKRSYCLAWSTSLKLFRTCSAFRRISSGKSSGMFCSLFDIWITVFFECGELSLMIKLDGSSR